MRRLLWLATYFFSGVAFWVPTTAMEMIEGYRYGMGVFDVLLIIVLPVYFSAKTLEHMRRKKYGSSRLGTMALLMLAGIWVLGPICIMVGASFSGGGFLVPDASHELMHQFWMFPAMTFVMSTYDLTLGSLIFVTVWLIVVSIKSFSRNTDDGLGKLWPILTIFPRERANEIDSKP